MSSKKGSEPEGSDQLPTSAVMLTTKAAMRVNAICAEFGLTDRQVDKLMGAIQELVSIANDNGRRVGYSAGYDAAHQDHVDGRVG